MGGVRLKDNYKLLITRLKVECLFKKIKLPANKDVIYKNICCLAEQLTFPGGE
jgi:hypothetical protein